MYQILVMGGDGKQNVRDYIHANDKGLECTGFVRRQIGE